jgi:hypothetical protein
MKLCDLLGTDLFQLSANFMPEDLITGDHAKIVEDLRELADLGAAHKPRPIRFAYEGVLLLLLFSLTQLQKKISLTQFSRKEWLGRLT